MLTRSSNVALFIGLLLAGGAWGCDDDRPLDQTPGVALDGGAAEDDAGTPDDAGAAAEDASVARDAGHAEDEGVVRLELGPVQTNVRGEAEVELELPEGVVSFTVVLVASREVTSIIKTMDGPEGRLVTDDPANVTQIEQFLLGPFAPQFKSPNRVIQDKGVAAALFPNNPMVRVTGGSYRMTIAAVNLRGNQATPYIGPVEVEVYYRTRALASGRLDVRLYFTGAGDLDSDSAKDSPMVQRALEGLALIYGQANLELGELSYHDVDSAYRTISGIDGSGDTLEQMFELTAGNGPGLHFFFVDRFEGGFPGAMVAGISGGLPGPPLRTGSPSSGVAVALSAVNGDPETLAHVMGHEGGHWLGLFHTSEITGTEDQLPDTPGGQAGQPFLMFPAVGGGTQISPSQATVMRHHVEVRAN